MKTDEFTREYDYIQVARHGKTILEAENTEAYDNIRNRLSDIVVGTDRQSYTMSQLCSHGCEDVLSMLTSSPSSVSMTYPETFIDYVNGTVRRIYLGATFGGFNQLPYYKYHVSI